MDKQASKCKYTVRRSGQIVALCTDKDQAFDECLPGDQVFQVVETHGEYGCINEHRIMNDNK